ncbi:MAG TPA: hypothetical protein VFU82_01495 [Gammaproteobacteria bacterium]|nr:hypothetical protein [Gammaproteobacteria bacterium]
MPNINPVNVSLSVLVIGDAQAKTSSLIKKFVNTFDLKKELPAMPIRRVPFDINNVEMVFTALDTDVNGELVANSDVILFCYNVNNLSSYETMLHCFGRVYKSYQGMMALVGCANEGLEPDKSIVGLGEDLSQILKSVCKQMYLDHYISSNHDVSCGVAQLILNFIADKALKSHLRPKVVHPLPKKPVFVKPEETVQALILGETGVGLLNQMTNGGGAYQDAQGGSHYCVELDEKNMHVMLNLNNNMVGVSPKDYAFAVLCFNLNQENAVEILSDEIKTLVSSNNKIFFALFGGHGDLQAPNQKGIHEAMMVLTQTLGEMYSYHFMGTYFDSPKNKGYGVAKSVLNVLCEKYVLTAKEEKALVSVFKAAHQAAIDGEIFARTTVPAKDSQPIDLDRIIHNASRTDVRSRSRSVFQDLGWFDKNGALSQDAPSLIKQRRLSLNISGARYDKKHTEQEPIKIRQG